jgi:hypothetical protein
MRSRIVAGLALAMAIAAMGPGVAQANGAPVVPYDTQPEHVWGDWEAQGTVIFDIGDTGGVGSGPPNPAMFTVPDGSWYTITSISTYHWNGSRGSTPGTLALQKDQGETLGPWAASGLALDRWWYVRPDVLIGPGTYTVIDSDPATWSYTSLSGGAGHTRILAETADPATTIQADARIRLGRGAFIGDDVYTATGAGQKLVTSARKGATVTFRVAIANDGTAADVFAVKGGGSSTGYAVRYFVGQADITPTVVAGTWQTPSLAPGASKVITVRVTVKSAAAVGSRIERRVLATSDGDATARDAVRLAVKRR